MKTTKCPHCGVEQTLREGVDLLAQVSCGVPACGKPFVVKTVFNEASMTVEFAVRVKT